MGFNCGIVGLPNVGKSTIFNALTKAHAEAANYPFCTIDPNVGIVPVPDERLQKIAQIIQPKKITPTTVEFVDIAGLVEGASKGEGLGNQFLGHIKDVDAIAHVVRCFEDANVTHVHGRIDPLRDMEVIKTELALRDLDAASKRQERLKKLVKVGDKKTGMALDLLESVQKGLNHGKWVSHQGLSEEEFSLIKDLFLLTAKPCFYVCNVAEDGSVDLFQKVLDFAKGEGVEAIKICGKFEAELAELEDEERKLFLKEAGLTESGLETMARTGYRALNLITFFTAGAQEVRAWTVHKGCLAPQAAGVIHSDFEKGFIKAETYHCEDLFRLGNEHKIKETGLLRMEGKGYVVQDGDVMLFKFNV